VRIFIVPTNLDGVRDGLLVRKACDILANCNVLSARPSGIVGVLPVVHVDESDLPRAMEALQHAGMKCLQDPLVPKM
jgi:hypothetical protein